jgi:hypothetical protein
MGKRGMLDWVVDPNTDVGIMGNLKGTDTSEKLGLGKSNHKSKKAKKKGARK